MKATTTLTCLILNTLKNKGTSPLAIANAMLQQGINENFRGVTTSIVLEGTTKYFLRFIAKTPSLTLKVKAENHSGWIYSVEVEECVPACTFEVTRGYADQMFNMLNTPLDKEDIDKFLKISIDTPN